MTIGISRTPSFRAHHESVSATAYGTREDPPGLEDIGRALGMIFAAGEAALMVDPYGAPEVSQSKWGGVGNGCRQLTFRIQFKVSSDDVLAGGPIHCERANEVGKAMYRALEERSRRTEAVLGTACAPRSRATPVRRRAPKGTRADH